MRLTSTGTVAHTTIKPTDKINLQHCLANIKRQSGYIQGFAVAYTYAGIEGRLARLKFSHHDSSMQ